MLNNRRSDSIPDELKHKARAKVRAVRMPRSKYIYYITDVEGQLLFDGQSFWKNEVIELLEKRSEQFRRENP